VVTAGGGPAVREETAADGPVLTRHAFGLALWLLGSETSGVVCPPGWPPPDGQRRGARVFGGQAGEVRVVRAFVRELLDGHPACPEAVVVASELASNSVGHSASRGDQGRFVVQAFRLGTGHAGLIVTDQGGPAVPPVPARLDQDAESGRGLLVVRSLSCWFRIHDHPDGHRSFAAAIPGTCGSTGRACRPADWIGPGW
jgi:serine/threonine-protein kinase RsbW